MNQKLCGCCQGVQAWTPETLANRPGLPSLHYRVGVHATFLETMKASLSGNEYASLLGLTTRESSDPTIALLDAWATVADVLTFYQERIANEGYLRTATERRSILELARLVGYNLQPGVSASVFLAFELEKDAAVEIPVGTRAQSLPGPNELPQPFETSEPLLARAEWNKLKPRMTRPQNITVDGVELSTNTIWLEGTSTNLEPNDGLLLFTDPDDCSSDSTYFRKVKSVDLDNKTNRTKIVLQGEIDAAALVNSGDAAIEITPARVPMMMAAWPNNIKDILKTYLNLEAFDVTKGSISDRITSRIETVIKDLASELSNDAVSDILTELLRSLNEELAYAESHRYSRLVSWLKKMVSALTTEREVLYAVRSAPAAPAFMAAESVTGNTSEVPTFPLSMRPSNLFRNIVKPPAIRPPVNALHLHRTPQTTFTKKSATAIDMLTRFSPGLRRTFLKAYANCRATGNAASDSVKSVQSLRVKAVPFGHNAPLEAITNGTGQVIGYREWLLEGQTSAAKDIHIKMSIQDVEPVMSNAYHGDVSFDIEIALWDGDEELFKETATIKTTDDAFEDFAHAEYETSCFGENDFLTSIRIKYQVIASEAGYHRVLISCITFEFYIASELCSSLMLALSDSNDEVLVTFDRGGRVIIEQGLSKGQLLQRHEQLFFIELDGLYRNLRAIIGCPIDKCTVPNVLTLDSTFEHILPNSCVVIEQFDPISHQPVTPKVCKVEAVRTISKAAYGITGKATELILDSDWLNENDKDLSVIRNTTVYAQGEDLTLCEVPISSQDAPLDIGEDAIELDGLYDGLEAGRWLVVNGERTDIKDEYENIISGVWDNELVMLAQVEHNVDKFLFGDTPHTNLLLANPLSNTYKRETVTIYGNVVKATHGETRKQVLGSGDSSQPLQQFALKQFPLTYLAAPTPEGVDSALEVRVDQVKWHETARLVDQKPDDRVYTVRTNDANQTSLIFGDGHYGARLPTGVENVSAVYRTGLGKDGNVDADRITMLATRPLGVKGVTNPRPATGGANRENRDQARRNAPVGVMALERLVSVQDYADFCRAFAGIDKASAVRLTTGLRTIVHITLAGVDNIPIDAHSDLYRNLLQSLHRHGDPYLPIKVDLYEPNFLVIAAKVRVVADYLWDVVAPKVRKALLTAFGFEQREFGQDALCSEAMRAIQSVDGVVYTDVDLFQAITKSDIEDEELLDAKIASLAEAGVIPRIVTKIAQWQSDGIRPAQLAYLTSDVPETLILTELT